MSTGTDDYAEADGRLPPHSRLAERAALGCVLRDNGVLDFLATRLRPEDFYLFAHQRAYEAMLHLRMAGKPIDYILLGQALEAAGHLADCGGHAYLVDLWDAAPGSAGNAKQYAETIRSKATARAIVHLGHELSELAGQPQAVPEELLEQADRQLGELAARIHTGQLVEQSEVIDDYLRDLERRSGHADDSGEMLDGPVETGWRDLDVLIAGVAPSELTLIAARPGIGKTLLGLCLARNVARRGLGVFFVSLEQKNRELGGRQIAAEARVNSRRLREAVLNIDERGRVINAAELLRGLPIVYDDHPYQGMFRIAASARRLKRQRGIRLVVVDYLQLIEPENRRDDRHEQVGVISRRLKLLARELDLPIVALAQLNRGAEERADQRPRLRDLRESGSLEQDADTVLLLHKPQAGDDQRQAELLEVIVAKCRSGPQGVATLVHDKRHFDVHDYAGPEPGGIP